MVKARPFIARAVITTPEEGHEWLEAVDEKAEELRLIEATRYNGYRDDDSE